MVRIRLLLESAMTSSEPATSMSLGARLATVIDLAPAGLVGEKWTTFSGEATHISPLGPATIEAGSLTSAISVALLDSLGSEGRNEATPPPCVTQILPSGSTPMPVG